METCKKATLTKNTECSAASSFVVAIDCIMLRVLFSVLQASLV